MKLFPERLPEQLQRGLVPVYLFAGPERLIVEEAADQVRRACRENEVAERIQLTAEARFDWDELNRATETGSLFATRRLVELRLPSGKPGNEGGKVIRAWIDDQRDDVLLILCDQWELAQEKSAWVKAVDKAGIYLPAWNVRPAQLPRWIAARLKSRGLSGEQSICAFLAERLEGNLLAAAQEVDRMALLYPNQHLSMEQVREAVADSARFDAFRLVELTFIGRPGAALRCIRGLKEGETPPPAVLWALGRELEVAWKVAGSQRPARQIYSEMRVWQARQGPIDALVMRNGQARIEKALSMLSRLDLLSKGQAAGDFWIELERFCSALAAPADWQTGWQAA